VKRVFLVSQEVHDLIKTGKVSGGEAFFGDAELQVSPFLRGNEFVEIKGKLAEFISPPRKKGYRIRYDVF